MLDTMKVKDKYIGDLLFPKNDLHIGGSVNKYGCWEESEINWINNNISLGMTCINIGANVGHHSIHMSIAVGDKGKVYAYEPASEIFYFLDNNIKNKKINNVIPIKKAVGKENKDIIIYLNEENHGDNRCFDPKEVNDFYGDFSDSGFLRNTREEVVELVTLDSDIGNEKIDLIVMDIQGLEIDALIGAYDMIKKSRPIILFEFTPSWMKQLDIDYDTAISNIINNFNYELLFLVADNEVPAKSMFEIEDFINNHGNHLYINVILRPNF